MNSQEQIIYFIHQTYSCSEEESTALINSEKTLWFDLHPESIDFIVKYVNIKSAHYTKQKKDFHSFIQNLENKKNSILVISSFDMIDSNNKKAYYFLLKLAKNFPKIYVMTLSCTEDIQSIADRDFAFYSDPKQYWDEESMKGRPRVYSSAVMDEAIHFLSTPYTSKYGKLKFHTYKEAQEKFGMCKNTIRNYLLKEDISLLDLRH